MTTMMIIIIINKTLITAITAGSLQGREGELNFDAFHILHKE